MAIQLLPTGPHGYTAPAHGAPWLCSFHTRGPMATGMASARATVCMHIHVSACAWMRWHVCGVYRHDLGERRVWCEAARDDASVQHGDADGTRRVDYLCCLAPRPATRTGTHTDRRTDTCTNAQTCMHAQARLQACMHARVCACTGKCMPAQVHTATHMHASRAQVANIHKHTQTHKHAQTHMQARAHTHSQTLKHASTHTGIVGSGAGRRRW